MKRTRKVPESMSNTLVLHVASPEELRDGALSRLRRLLRLRRDHFDELNDEGLRMLERGIFASYCDCVDAGCTAEAKAIMRDVRLTRPLVPKKAKVPGAGSVLIESRK